MKKTYSNDPEEAKRERDYDEKIAKWIKKDFIIVGTNKFGNIYVPKSNVKGHSFCF